MVNSVLLGRYDLIVAVRKIFLSIWIRIVYRMHAIITMLRMQSLTNKLILFQKFPKKLYFLLWHCFRPGLSRYRKMHYLYHGSLGGEQIKARYHSRIKVLDPFPMTFLSIFKDDPVASVSKSFSKLPTVFSSLKVKLVDDVVKHWFLDNSRGIGLVDFVQFIDV